MRPVYVQKLHTWRRHSCESIFQRLLRMSDEFHFGLEIQVQLAPSGHEAYSTGLHCDGGQEDVLARQRPSV